jgi:uncharacterized sulfatase
MPSPNFLFIMTDSQGANVLGRPELHTPNLDRLAAEGINFQRAYSTCPICTPARSAIFTGQYPHSNGAWANEQPLADTCRTMGQRFRDQGWRTAYVGKWHLSGTDYFDTGICPDGWEDAWWYDGRRYMDDLSDDDRRRWRQELTTTEQLLAADIPAGFTWGHRISDRALRFLGDRQDRPFVLALSYDEPHGPCTCPKSYVERFQDHVWDPGPSAHEDLGRKPRFQRELQRSFQGWFRSDGKMHYPPYFACNSFVDQEIGRVLAVVPDNTWVIFTSDHGAFMGEHGGLGGKGTVMYEESARIPLIIRGPHSSRPPGRVDRSVVSHIDILPTMLDLAGLAVPPVFDGHSLAPHLHEARHDPDRAVVIEWNRADADIHGAGAAYSGLFPVRCAVSQRWKLVLNLADEDELYDLERDPHELENRINDPACAAERDALHHRLLAWMDDHRDPFRGAAWIDRPWSNPARRYRPDGNVVVRADDGYLPPTLEYGSGRPHPRPSRNIRL